LKVCLNTNQEQMDKLNDIKFLIMISLTLGLAPFFPEPHIWGKLKLLIDGQASGFDFMDWFDVLLHGTPWILLFRALIIKALGKI
jgi:hypothetical protein